MLRFISLTKILYPAAEYHCAHGDEMVFCKSCKAGTARPWPWQHSQPQTAGFSCLCSAFRRPWQGHLPLQPTVDVTLALILGAGAGNSSGDMLDPRPASGLQCGHRIAKVTFCQPPCRSSWPTTAHIIVAQARQLLRWRWIMHGQRSEAALAATLCCSTHERRINPCRWHVGPAVCCRAELSPYRCCWPPV